MADNHEARFERIEQNLEAHSAAIRRIDERLNRIAERHEALAQTVEILAGMQRAAEERARANDERIGLLTDAFTRLVRIVESH